MPGQPPADSWRRGLRLSVRALMVVVLVTGGGIGWVMYRARVQRDAVAAIEQAGGKVTYDWNYKDGVINPKGTPRAPKWLLDRLGADYFGDVLMVRIDADVTDRVLARAGDLGRLEELHLYGPSVTDSRMKFIEGMTTLRSLRLCSTRVTDAGLVHLKGLANLKCLNLDSNKIDGHGLVYLNVLPQLEELRVTMQTEVLDSLRAEVNGPTVLRKLDLIITDAQLVHLKGLRQLKSLELSFANITDAGLVHLKGLNRLERLSLDYTDITDAGLVQLKGLDRLERLSLDHTDITDAGLLHLIGLNRLQRLSLADTNIGDGALEHLKGLNHLRELCVSGTSLTVVGLMQLQSWSDLRGLMLTGSVVNRARFGVSPAGPADDVDKTLNDLPLPWRKAWIVKDPFR